MDPKATLRLMTYCMSKRDFQEAAGYALALERWRINGGFMPEMKDVEKEIFSALLAIDAAHLKAFHLYSDEE